MDQTLSAAGRDISLVLIEEVERIVSSAASVGGTLRIGPHAKLLSSLLASTGLSERCAADELIRAAACAGIPVEL